MGIGSDSSIEKIPQAPMQHQPTPLISWASQEADKLLLLQEKISTESTANFLSKMKSTKDTLQNSIEDRSMTVNLKQKSQPLTNVSNRIVNQSHESIKGAEKIEQSSKQHKSAPLILQRKKSMHITKQVEFACSFPNCKATFEALVTKQYHEKQIHGYNNQGYKIPKELTNGYDKNSKGQSKESSRDPTPNQSEQEYSGMKRRRKSSSPSTERKVKNVENTRNINIDVKDNGNPQSHRSPLPGYLSQTKISLVQSPLSGQQEIIAEFRKILQTKTSVAAGLPSSRKPLNNNDSKTSHQTAQDFKRFKEISYGLAAANDDFDAFVDIIGDVIVSSPDNASNK